ncbi:MAG TPA: hypothetical protein PLY87_29155 [Planctomycetaceae bacterium]|nr:hypothetical protein [Planctomycetaceae bacterium]HQZ69204.1 hypothetical protein [Planctomycetaceae bacterium]
MLEFPDEIVERLEKYCHHQGIAIAPGPPGIGLEAMVWITEMDSVIKVHRLATTFDAEFAVYQKLAETNTHRLKGFAIPQLLHYDTELLVMELSFVRPPYILDFGAASVSPRPPDFDLDRIETEFQRQFGREWPEVRRLLEALMQIGIYYSDAHDKNIRLR